MSAPIDVRAGLAAELRRLVRDGREWPITDRRRFRNLLLDAVSSDAMPMVELLLRVYDDGMLRTFPDRSAPRATWDAAAARLAGDLQAQRFVEPGIARFVAESWAAALGPELTVAARAAAPRVTTTVPRQPPRSSATVATAQRAAATAQAASASSAASMQAYRLSNILMGAMGVMFLVFVFVAFRQTGARAQVTPATVAAPVRTPAAMPVPAAQAAPLLPVPGDSVRESAAPEPAPSAPTPRSAIDVAAATVRSTDDIVLKAGRVFEGRVLSIRQQSIVVKDEETGLDFEIAKADVDRIVTRENRVMRFGDDNVPLLGDADAVSPMSHTGRYRLRYAARWGTERDACGDVARRWAPGADLVIRHLRGAPMMRLEFTGGMGYNAGVRSDGLFESGVATSPARGPDSTFVSSRLSGRLSRGGVLQGVARVSAVKADGAIVCDLALTVRGERQP
ncbi:MAG: hypothetical protein V4813_18365 [Gemmatimonadota bacterium]